MAKHLIPASKYTVNRSQNTIELDGNIQLDQLLLITNITAGKGIYQFNSTAKGASRFFDPTREVTTLTTTYDIANDADITDDDEYQVFIEVESEKFSPAESLLDAVGKLRVSNPGNLIDTDFEYGLQSTKWETLQTVNNIPTVYSSAGDIPVEGITAVDSIEGSKQVKVTVNTPHSLSIGDPVSVQGLQDYQAEGFFIVSGVPDALSFFFELDVNSSTTGNISGGYTTIIGAKFFEGSPLNISTEDGAQTDGASPSKISVTTTETHGFSPGTKVYLRNTVGPKRLQVADPTSLAPDGRPYVDTEAFFSVTDTIGTTNQTSRGGLRENNVIAYDWESTYTLYLSTTNVDGVANQITWANHEMKDNYCVLFNTPTYNSSDCGMQDGTIFYVKRIDGDTIELYTDQGLSNIVSLSDPVSTKGAPRLGLAYRIIGTAGNARNTPYSAGFGGSIRYTGASQWVVSGSGTAASPYNGYSTGQRYSGDNSYAYFTVDNAGDIYWGMSVSSEPCCDRHRFYIGGTNYVNISGITSRTGVTYAGAGTSVYSNYYKDGSVNTYSDRAYIDYLYMSGGGTPDVDASGSDFATYNFGLGKVQPTRVIAFQGRTAGSVSNSQDAYSYLANQRVRGRYGAIAGQYSNTVSSTTSEGVFNMNYNDNTDNYSSSAEYFYVFANDLISDRNTFYVEDHNLISGQIATVQSNGNAFSNGERWTFADSSGNPQVIGDEEFEVEINVITNSLFRISRTDAPATGDILDFPESGFQLDFRQNNATFNSIYVFNHKITGQAEAVYQIEGLNEPSPTEYDITNDGMANYIFNGTTLPVDASDPTLIVYRGLSYDFNVNATGHPLYITTDDGTGYVAGDYIGEYTTGITGSRTQVGTLAWTVDASAPNTLYYQCGNHAEMRGTIEVRDAGTAIGGITNDQSYNLQRINDSRLSLSQLVNTSATALSQVVGAANNNTVTVDIDVQTPLGITPTDASIQRVEFRGDFGFTSEYVLMSFEDGESFFVGQRNGADSSVWQIDDSFPVKNIGSLLKDIGGGTLGISVTFDPTSQVNFTPRGMSNWWEIRFTLSGDSGVVTLSSGGAGLQEFVVNNVVGSYDGVFEITTIPSPKEFHLSTDFEIPARRYNFVSGDMDGTNDTITFAEPHNFITGERVYYQSNGNDTIFSLEVTSFFVIVVDDVTIKVAESNLSALNNIALDLTVQTGTHSIIDYNVIKNNPGEGVVSTSLNGNVITGSGTKFLTQFKRFDKIYVTGPDYVQEYTVNSITTNEKLTIFETFDYAVVDVDYYYATQMVLRPDGFSLHKSFDGGVDITAGTSPNSKIVRQSRKYFRYQSGKGIQNSFAVNFNPPKIVRDLIRAEGTTAQVNTQEQHNLAVGDGIIIEGSEVTQGLNTYNGTFTVTDVADPFTFSYEMPEEPTQQKAGGYPTYVRQYWNDSYIRAGMFDDQNGFFMEFDGQNLYMVRRSSTLQLAGDVTVNRGSQVVQGRDTSFTTQLNSNDKIVIRGQTYQIVEVSSDTRLVVQPAYRGVDARGVKLTRTVDVRVVQSDWNLDKCDGTGPSGFVLDTKKLQMAYADYSWYGAGKIRFGFKQQNGHIVYVHEFIHNNKLNESYFRSGNLPGRYEIENGPAATTAPTLFHFGTSIIMDGRFDDDKAYLFTANSRPFAYTNGASVSYTSSGSSTFELVTLNGRRVWVYTIPVSQTDASATTVGSQIRDSGNAIIPEGVYVTQVKVDGSSSAIYTSYPATATEPGGSAYPDLASSSTVVVGETTAVELTQPLPLVSIRLAPSVDSSLTGAVGEREIINRMQLGLKQAGVTSNQDIEIFLIINSLPSNFDLDKADTPSLSEVIDHAAGETLIGGTTIYSVKSSAGSVEIDLAELLELGNSILGGDGIFPAGPDLLTLAIQPQSTSDISGANPFFVSGKISWSESQA